MEFIKVIVDGKEFLLEKATAESHNIKEGQDLGPEGILSDAAIESIGKMAQEVGRRYNNRFWNRYEYDPGHWL